MRTCIWLNVYSHSWWLRDISVYTCEMLCNINARKACCVTLHQHWCTAQVSTNFPAGYDGSHGLRTRQNAVLYRWWIPSRQRCHNRLAWLALKEGRINSLKQASCTPRYRTDAFVDWQGCTMSALHADLKQRGVILPCGTACCCLQHICDRRSVLLLMIGSLSLARLVEPVAVFNQMNVVAWDVGLFRIMKVCHFSLGSLLKPYMPGGSYHLPAIVPGWAILSMRSICKSEKIGHANAQHTHAGAQPQGPHQNATHFPWAW